jgi:site-specific recombinase XerD
MKNGSTGVFERPPHSGVWWVSYRDGAGDRHREKVGGRDAALVAVAERRSQVLEGRYVPPQTRRRTMTFRTLASEAMEHRKLRLRPRSYDTDVSRLGMLLPLMGGMATGAVTAAETDRVLDGLRTRGLAGSTANRYRSLLSAIFAYGARTGRIPSNPLQLAKRFRESEGRVRYLLQSEEKKLRAVIRANCPRREAELDLALYTGMRRGEQFTLAWRDVDLERGILTVRGKTGMRHIVLNSKARSAIKGLAQRRKGAAFVCPEAKSGEQRDWRRWFEGAVQAAGIEDFHWHDLRHTFASRLVMKGVDIRTVQELMGHRSIVTTMRYAHLSPDHRQAAAEKICAAPSTQGK